MFKYSIMKKNTPFHHCLCYEIYSLIGKNGVNISVDTIDLSSPSKLTTIDEKAKAWAQAIVSKLLSAEPRLLNDRFLWKIGVEKYSQIYFKGFNVDESRFTYKFNLRLTPPLVRLKNISWVLGENKDIFGRPMDSLLIKSSSRVLTSWTAEVGKGFFDWNSIDAAITDNWQKTLLRGWRNYTSTSTPQLYNSLLDFFIGTTDTYFIHKIPRANTLNISLISRLNDEQIAVSPTLVYIDDTPTLEIPITSNNRIYMHVKDHRSLTGLCVKSFWTLRNKTNYNTVVDIS